MREYGDPMAPTMDDRTTRHSGCPIHQAFESVEMSCNELEKRLLELAERLDPVMAAEIPVGIKEGPACNAKMEMPSSRVTIQIRDISRFINRMNEQVGRLMGRLEI